MPLYVSGIAVMEVFAGCRDKSEWLKAEAFFAPFEFFWLSEQGFSTALSTILPLRLANGIGLTDALIASTALEHNHPLATFNTKHFSQIAGLQVVQPYQRS
jgi:predicted nucleic acid-binding protein